MKIKELKEILKEYDDEREVCLWDWDKKTDEGRFFSLTLSATPKANSKNMLVFIDNGLIEPIRETKKEEEK